MVRRWTGPVRTSLAFGVKQSTMVMWFAAGRTRPLMMTSGYRPEAARKAWTWSMVMVSQGSFEPACPETDRPERQAEDGPLAGLGERGEGPSEAVGRHLLLRRPKRIRNSFSSAKVSSLLKSVSRSLTAVSNSGSRSPKRWGAAKEVE